MRLIIYTLAATLLLLVSCTGEEKETDKQIVTADSSKKDTIALKATDPGPSSVSFAVDDVQIASRLLPVSKAKAAFQNNLEYRILAFPDEQKDSVFVEIESNGLMGTVHQCYASHRPLVLSPDVLWLTICQGISIHVNKHFDSLQSHLFVADKPKTLVIRNDSLAFSSAQWQKAISELSQETRKYTKADYYSQIVADYSTTTSIEQTAYQTSLLETYKKAFDYVFQSACGIPTITLKGTKADWADLKDRLDLLDSLGMHTWADNLRPVMDEFIHVYDHKINTAFWKDIYKDAEEYGGYYTSGWIIKFFPYVLSLHYTHTYDTVFDPNALEKRYDLNPFISDDPNAYLHSTLLSNSFPSGICDVNVSLENLATHKTKRLSLCAGIFAARQYADKSLEPVISWAVCNKSDYYFKDPYAGYIRPAPVKHDYKCWWPFPCKNILQAASYDTKKYTSTKAGLKEVQRILEDSLNAAITDKSLLKNLQISFMVYTNGMAGNVKVANKKNERVAKTVQRTLLHLPAAWLPALAYASEASGMIPIDPKDAKKKIAVNSTVRLNLFTQ